MRFTIFRLTSFGTSEFFDIVMFLFMGDKMKHILQDNALESWAMAIKYSNFILNGKAILQYRKQFVSSLHNAVELFIKQLMLDNNDHRVCSVRKGCDAGGHPAVEFYNAADLNSYFEKLADEDMKKFYSIEFNEIQRLVKELFSGYYGEHSADKVVVDDSIALLGRLRTVSYTHLTLPTICSV